MLSNKSGNGILGTHRNLIVKEFDVFDGLVKHRCSIRLKIRGCGGSKMVIHQLGMRIFLKRNSKDRMTNKRATEMGKKNRKGYLSKRRDQLLERSDSVPELLFPHLPAGNNQKQS